MDGWLKQSTSIEVKIGPFVSSTDGVTPQTSLTITSSEVLLSKNEGDWAAKNESTSLVHESNGFYRCLFNTTDTNTLALLRYQIAESGCLPVWGSFLVVPANVWDSFFSTDLLQVDLTQWLGSAPNALVSNRIDASIGAITNGIITDASIATTAAAKIRSVTRGTADSGSTTTMVDAARTETDVDHWKGSLILFGTGLNQSRLITGFNPTTDTITFTPPTTQAISTHEYEILPAARVDLHSWLGSVVNSLVAGRVDASVGAMAADTLTAAATAADFLAEVNTEVDTALADYDAPTFAELDARTDAIEADTQDIQSRLPAALVSGRVDASVGAVAANAITDTGVAADMDAYHAKVWVVKEDTTADHYAVVFFKNGQPVTSGITSPTIQVIKASDGTDLIASAALTEVGSLGIYKKDESTNKLIAGAIYFAKVQATIDGSTRVWLQQVGRDSA